MVGATDALTSSQQNPVSDPQGALDVKKQVLESDPGDALNVKQTPGSVTTMSPDDQKTHVRTCKQHPNSRIIYASVLFSVVTNLLFVLCVLLLLLFLFVLQILVVLILLFVRDVISVPIRSEMQRHATLL